MLSLQGPQQSLSLGIIPIDSAALYFTHDKIAYNHSCYECKRSNEPSVCHKLSSSILRLLVPVCLRTIECLVNQFAPNINMSGHFESILLTFLQFIPVPPPWSDGRRSKDLRLCTTALSFCLPVRSISQREITHNQVTFQLLRWRFLMRTFFCIHQKRLSFNLHSRCVHPNTRGQEMVSVLQDQPISSISCT